MSHVPFDRRSVPVDASQGFVMADDGWRIRTIELKPEGVPRGSILFAGGRADFIEKYLESLLHWRQCGWTVTAFDWRGQGGSGRLVEGSVAGHIDDFSRWVADFAGIERVWRAATSGPHILVGHSMGGHLLLRYLAEHGPPVAGAVLSSPMAAFRVPLPERLVRWVSARMAAGGCARDYAWGQGDRPVPYTGVRQRRLTSDKERYVDELWWLNAKPELAMGGTSWGWLAAAYRSIDRVAAPGFLEDIRTPVLLVASWRDRVVRTRAAIAAVRRIPAHEIALFPGEHELLRERDPCRLAVWNRIDRFMADLRDPATATGANAMKEPLQG